RINPYHRALFVMTLRHATPLPWRPLGITDAIDGSMARQGSMASLKNLVADPSTLGVFNCRPASILLQDFNAIGSGPFSSRFSSRFQTTFFTPTGSGIDITCLVIFGNQVYGMISGPGGFDYPFTYNLTTNTLVTVTNQFDTTKLPNTVPTTGEWNPFPPKFA